MHKGDICKLAEQAGYLAENAGRRCREMVTGKTSSGKPCPIVLERKEVKGSVWYRSLEAPLPTYSKVEINGVMVVIQR